MPIAWHLTKVCVYHNTALKTMRIAGCDIPYCERCVGKGGYNPKKAQKVNSYANKELGKENFVPLWDGKRKSRIVVKICKKCRNDFQVKFSFSKRTNYCSKCKGVGKGGNRGRVKLPCPKTHGGPYLLETKNLKKQRMSYAKHKTHRIQTP